MRLKKQLLGVTLALLMIPTAHSQSSHPPEGQGMDTTATLHPALFLVGDSIMKTGNGTGENGQWGWGSEIIPLFDPIKIHVYNEAHGGRSSRSYIEEGLWAKVLDHLQPGDFILLQFGHNDSSNSQNYSDRATITGGGDESMHVGLGTSNKVVRTYGWYLREYVKEAKAKGAVIIICSPVPRNTWADGKIKRGFDGYAEWAADAAKASGALFIDLNTIAANHYDALGKEKTAELFSDYQHTKKAGARLNAESVVIGLKQLKDCPLASDLAPASAATPSP